jgi:hypothetical protein
LCNTSRCMVVMVMWCPLDVVVVMDRLARAILRDAVLSSIERNGSVRYGKVILGLVMVVMMMVMAVPLATLQDADICVYLLMMWRVVVVVVPSVIVLIALRATDARGCAPPIIAIHIKDILVLDSFHFPALLRVHTLQSHHISRFWILRKGVLSVVKQWTATRRG